MCRMALCVRAVALAVYKGALSLLSFLTYGRKAVYT